MHQSTVQVLCVIQGLCTRVKTQPRKVRAKTFAGAPTTRHKIFRKGSLSGVLQYITLYLQVLARFRVQIMCSLEKKHARVSFSKTIYLRFLKTHECIFFLIAREIMPAPYIIKFRECENMGKQADAAFSRLSLFISEGQFCI